MYKNILLLAVIVIIVIFTGCSQHSVSPGEEITPLQSNNPSEESGTTTGNEPDTVMVYTPISVKYDDDDLDTSWNGSASSNITFNGSSITLEGDGGLIDGNKITITSAGTYIFSGILDDGQIIIDSEDNDPIKLVLKETAITCSDSAPIYVRNADKTVLILADGTDNYIRDGEEYKLDDEESNEPNAAIFSKDDLTITGNGSLTVTGNYNNGIQSTDDIKITGGNISVTANNDGIKANDSIAIKNGNITVEAVADGMQSENGDDVDKGFISVEGGTIDITAGKDGIQAITNVLISGGNLSISSGGGSINSSTNTGMEGNTWGTWGDRFNTNNPDNNDTLASAKGIKADVNVTITAGTIDIDSSDDSIHSNDSLIIDGGDIVLTSGDDGIHSDSTMEINGGDIIITKSYEGIESSVITINDGTVHISANDDGINAAGGVDGSSVDGRPGQNNFEGSGNHYLYVNGGYIYIDAQGDGIDINGSILMTAGSVIVNGPTSNNNGALDYLGDFNISGGFFVAAGSSGMAQAPSDSSTQCSVMLNLETSLSAGTLFHIEAKDGKEILTFLPTKSYQSIVVSSPELENGETYMAYYGGSTNDTATDGLYSGDSYTAGTEVETFTISSIITRIGSSGGMPGGGGPGGGRRR